MNDVNLRNEITTRCLRWFYLDSANWIKDIACNQVDNQN